MGDESVGFSTSSYVPGFAKGGHVPRRRKPRNPYDKRTEAAPPQTAAQKRREDRAVMQDLRKIQKLRDEGEARQHNRLSGKHQTGTDVAIDRKRTKAHPIKKGDPQRA
jgi:hypothetical protein